MIFTAVILYNGLIGIFGQTFLSVPENKALIGMEALKEKIDQMQADMKEAKADEEALLEIIDRLAG